MRIIVAILLTLPLCAASCEKPDYCDDSLWRYTKVCTPWLLQ